MSNSTNTQVTALSTTSQDRAATLVKRVIVPANLNPSTDRQTAKPSLINRVGTALANYDRADLAERGSDALAGWVKQVSKVAINDALYTGEHVIVDTASVALQTAEVIGRKSINGSAVVIESITNQAGKTVKRIETRSNKDQGILKSAAVETGNSAKAVAIEASDRAGDIANDLVTKPITKRFQKQNDVANQLVASARKKVQGYTVGVPADQLTVDAIAE